MCVVQNLSHYKLCGKFVRCCASGNWIVVLSALKQSCLQKNCANISHTFPHGYFVSYRSLSLQQRTEVLRRRVTVQFSQFHAEASIVNRRTKFNCCCFQHRNFSCLLSVFHFKMQIRVSFQWRNTVFLIHSKAGHRSPWNV